MPRRSDSRVLKSACRLCSSCCGIDARVEGGRLVKVSPMREHPVRRLCVKSQAIPDLLYSPERITHPMQKINGAWREISWDEALDIIAGKLAGIRDKYGARALLVYLGEPTVGTEVPKMASRFCSLYGTPNYTSGASICFAARAIGHGLTISRRMLPLLPSYAGTHCVVVWGHNPKQSNPGEEADIISALRRGARLVVVDPVATQMAKKADLHIQVRPGTDCALALGLLNVIITEGLYDRDFVGRWTLGFDELKEHVRQYSPGAVEKVTWVPAAKIRQFAHLYAESRPAAISQDVALDHCTNGVQTSRAIAILIAITGNLDVVGGNVYNPPLRQASIRIKGGASLDEAIGAGYPIFGRFVGNTTAMPAAEAVITEKPYPLKAMIIQAANPALTWPDSNRVRQALEKLELLVVSDIFMTETARLADIFLPAASLMEGRSITDYATKGLPLIALSDRVVEPPADCREDWRLWAELGKKMGYADYFPWRSADELFNFLLEPSGVTLEQLEQNPGGIVYRPLDRQRKYEQEGFNTPSGKVELFSSTLAEHGYDPLPTFIPQEDLSERYPFTLVTGSRTIAYSQSRYRNIPRLRKLVPEPVVEINPAPAGKMGIADGEPVVLESPKGSLVIKATFTQDIHPLALSIQHGWEEANANLLTDNEPSDPISGYPVFKAIPCRVRKVSE